MIKKLASAILIVSLLILTACDNESNQSKDIIDIGQLGKLQDNIEYSIKKVVREDIIEDLDINLMISNRYNREISFDHDVTVKEFFVNKNGTIEKGTLIMELDSTKIDREIEDNKFLLGEEIKFYDGMRNLGYSSKEVRIQELEIRILEKKIAGLLKKKESYKIYAQNDSFIIYGDPKKGNKYRAGQTLIKLTEASGFIIRTPRDINLAKFNNVDIGDVVKIMLKLNSGDCKARVSYIKRKDNLKGEIYFEDISNMPFFNTRKDSKRIDGEFKSVVIKNVLSVSKSAIKFKDKAYVETMKDGKRRVRYVTIGAVGKNEKGEAVVEILSGLKEGEEVIVRKTYKAGADVFRNLIIK